MKKASKLVVSNVWWKVILGIGILFVVSGVFVLFDSSIDMITKVVEIILGCGLIYWGYYLMKQHKEVPQEEIDQFNQEKEQKAIQKQNEQKLKNSSTQATYVGGIEGLPNNVPVTLTLDNGYVLMDGAGTPVRINLENITGIAKGTEEEIIQTYRLKQKGGATRGIIKGTVFGAMFGGLGAAAGVVSGATKKSKLETVDQVKKTVVTVITYLKDNEINGVSFINVKNPKFFELVQEDAKATGNEYVIDL